MPKRIQIALAALFLLIGGVIVWAVLRDDSDDLIIDGKPLASWLDSYPDRKTPMAEAALEKAGTNAIPTLLRMARQRDSTFKRMVMGVVQKQHVIKVHYIPAERRNQAAYFVFLELGARGKTAVPGLIGIYEQGPSPTSQTAAACLGAIGPEATAAIPALMRGVTSSNILLRCDTLWALGRIQRPDLIVPVLINALTDPNARVRLVACISLGDVGGAAHSNTEKVWNPDDLWVKQAVSALVKVLNDSSPDVKRVARVALGAIDPEAAAKAGMN